MSKAVPIGLLLAAIVFVGAGCAKTPAPAPVSGASVVPDAVQPTDAAPPVADVLGVDSEVDSLLEAIDSESSALVEESADASETNSDSDAVKSFTDATYDVE